MALVAVAAGAAIFTLLSGDEPDQPPDEPPGTLAWAFHRQVGDCLDLTADGEVEERACDGPHDQEIFAILAHPAGPDEPWPGKEESRGVRSAL